MTVIRPPKSSVHKRDDAFGHADHIGRHAHAAIAIRVKRVLQVLCHG